MATSSTPEPTQPPATTPKDTVAKANPKPGPLLLNKFNFLVTDFLSQNESRYTLNGVNVSTKGTEATDGHVAVRISLPDQKGSVNYPSIRNFTPEHSPKPFLIPRDTAKRLRSAIPKDKNIKILNHVAVGQGDEFTLELAVTDLNKTQVFQPHKMNGKFPDVDSVFALAEKDAQFEIAVNPDYLMRICRAAKSFTKNRFPAILLRFSSATGALGLYAKNDEGQTMSALVMPMIMGRADDFGLKKLPAKPPMPPTIPTAVPNIPTVALGEKKDDEVKG